MKIWTVEEIKTLLSNNNIMVEHSLKVLYERQTVTEQVTRETTEQNGIGFNGVDASFLTSCAQFYINAGFLTPRQIVACRKKLLKYIRQLARIANHEI